MLMSACASFLLGPGRSVASGSYRTKVRKKCPVKNVSHFWNQVKLSTRCFWHLCSSWPLWKWWWWDSLLLSVPMGLSPCAPVAMATLRTSPPFLLVTSRRFSIKHFFIFLLTPHFQGKPKCECPGGGGLASKYLKPRPKRPCNPGRWTCFFISNNWPSQSIWPRPQA